MRITIIPRPARPTPPSFFKKANQKIHQKYFILLLHPGRFLAPISCTAICIQVVPTLSLDTLLPLLPGDRVELKIDAQGHEYHILQGAREYLATRPVYYILLEYYPKGLRAGGVDPRDLLTLLQHTLGYQCFDLRCTPSRKQAKRLSAHGRHALTFNEFIAAYPAVAANEFGTWTDLLCTRFDLM